MNTTVLVAAVAFAASSVSAQSMYITASNPLPVYGEVITLDVVLDATSYAGEFFAWHEFQFNIDMTTNRDPVGLAAAVGGNLLETDILETADTTGFAAGGRVWTGGRRPGALPGSASNNGGSRFGPQLADVVTDTFIGSSVGDGTISGRQQSPAAPEHNALINSNRVYEIFRFQLTYSREVQFASFFLTNVSVNLFTDPAGNNVFVQDQMFISGFGFIPAPGVVPVLLVGGVLAGRRRRWG